MTSIFSLNQRINQLMSTIDKMQTKITSTATTPLILTGNTSININFNNMGFMTLSLNMTNNIQQFTFQNSVINGNYKIFLHSASPFVLNKNLGLNIVSNLNGNLNINGYYCIDIFYTGTIYFLKFTNYT